MRHIAILHARYIDAILEGRKVVETRLSLTRCAPFGLVTPGDEILFKQSGGPFRACARVAGVMTFEDLRPSDVRALARRYGDLVGADDAYWEARIECRYATLMWLGDASPDVVTPKFARKAGARSAWYLLESKPRAAAA